MTNDDEYTYLGNFSAVEPVHSRYMVCDDCKVTWTGCWDNFQCPKCGGGELPSTEVTFPTRAKAVHVAMEGNDG